MMSPQERVSQAKAEICLSHVFYSALLLKLKVEETKRPDLPTMATDGTRLLWNANFVTSIPDSEVRGVLVHEILHCVLRHIWRLKESGFDLEKANRAADYAINLLIVDFNKEVGNSGCSLELPSSALLDEKYRDMSFEEIYHALPSEPEPQPNDEPDDDGDQGDDSDDQGDDQQDGDDGDQGGSDGGDQPKEGGKGGGKPQEPMSCGEIHPPNAFGESDDEQEPYSEIDWVDAAEVAARAQEMSGTESNSIRKLMGTIRASQEDWRAVLARFVDSKTSEDFSWQARDRRCQDFYLPDIQSDQLGEIAVGVDTSGSIYSNPGILESFAAEIGNILTLAKPKVLHLLQVDTELKDYQTFEPSDKFELEAIGGGGTRFEPYFTEIEKRALEVKALIVLTDGYGSFPKVEPDYPVIWVSYGAKADRYPFGEVVTINS